MNEFDVDVSPASFLNVDVCPKCGGSAVIKKWRSFIVAEYSKPNTMGREYTTYHSEEIRCCCPCGYVWSNMPEDMKKNTEREFVWNDKKISPRITQVSFRYEPREKKSFWANFLGRGIFRWL